MRKSLFLGAFALASFAGEAPSQCPFMGMRQGIMSSPCRPQTGPTNNLFSVRLDNVNCALTLRTVQTRGPLVGVYLVGASALSPTVPIVPPCELVIDPLVILPAPRGVVTLPIPPSIPSGRVIVYAQGFFFDQQPPQLSQMIVTNGLAIQFV